MNTQMDITHQEKQQTLITLTWLRLISCVTHDLRTPLSSIHLWGSVVGKLFPTLLKSYRLAVSQQLMDHTLDEAQLKLLENRGFEHISLDVKAMQSFLQQLYEDTQNLHPDLHTVQPLSLNTCIETVLDTIPFQNPSQRSLIHIDLPQDVTCNTIPLVATSCLTQIIEQALQRIAAEKKGHIELSTEQAGDHVILYIKDTAGSISEYAQEALFNRFFTTHDDKSRTLALGLCRLALLLSNGDVSCRTLTDVYTMFIIKLPLEALE